MRIVFFDKFFDKLYSILVSLLVSSFKKRAHIRAKIFERGYSPAQRRSVPPGGLFHNKKLTYSCLKCINLCCKYAHRTVQSLESTAKTRLFIA